MPDALHPAAPIVAASPAEPVPPRSAHTGLVDASAVRLSEVDMAVLEKHSTAFRGGVGRLGDFEFELETRGIEGAQPDRFTGIFNVHQHQVPDAAPPALLAHELGGVGVVETIPLDRAPELDQYFHGGSCHVYRVHRPASDAAPWSGPAPSVAELTAVTPGAFYAGPLGQPAVSAWDAMKPWLEADLDALPSLWPQIDVAHPDPHPSAHVGDPVPGHPFFAPMPAALGPVLRQDSDRARELISAREFLDQMDLVYPDRPARPAAPSRLRRLWEVYHEWITAGFFIGVALAAAAFNH